MNLKIFMVTYDRLEDRAIDNLTDEEVNHLKCYAVQKNVDKKISKRVEAINEWELAWNDYEYQNKQYYEYGAIVHLINNPHLLEGVTHVGLLHYDVLFGKNSVNELKSCIEQNPNQIFYQRIRGIEDLYLTKFEVDRICEFMQERLGIRMNPEKIWISGWVSEALSVTSIEVFSKFGEFIKNHRHEREDILVSNRWGIMNHINHRVCGIVERMWGFYLVSLEWKMQKMNIEHDWDYYTHKHLEEKNWIK
jgi:hypothetical protein